MLQSNAMSKKEKTDKLIDAYKNLLSILIVALFGMVAFLFINADNLSALKTSVLVCGIVFMLIIVGIVVWQYIKNLNRLGEMDDK